MKLARMPKTIALMILAAGASGAQASDLPKRAKGPVTLVVSTQLQQLTVYDGFEAVASTSISSGVPGHPTPHGIFSIIEKQKFHQSNIYSAAPMPFMQRLTWSGVALHQGHVTGSPASHGCVRLPAAFAQALFSFTREGARVVIARDEPIMSPLYGTEPFAQASVKFRRAPEAPGSSPKDETTSDEMPGELPMRGAFLRPTEPKDFSAKAPISIIVSRKAGKIYVRRAFTPLFEATIAIEGPRQPLGLHLFTAAPAANGGLSWGVVSVSDRVSYADAGNLGEIHRVPNRLFVDISEESVSERKKRRLQAMDSFSGAGMGALASGPTEALNRLQLSDEAGRRLIPLLSAGATLILSDDGARGKETWNGTNFIALSE